MSLNAYRLIVYDIICVARDMICGKRKYTSRFLFMCYSIALGGAIKDGSVWRILACVAFMIITFVAEET